jgi:hypothetical protein
LIETAACSNIETEKRAFCHLAALSAFRTSGQPFNYC